MSRTRIFSIKMENKMNVNDLSSLLGLNAYSIDESSTYFQNLVNKSLGDGKQYTGNSITNMPDVNNSLLNTLNMIDSSIKTQVFDMSSKDDNTYTLDDLLDLGNEELNPSVYFDPSLDSENAYLSSPQNLAGTEILFETAMASPLSSSSEESCDLDEILFMDSNLVSNNIVPPQETDQMDASNSSEMLEQESVLETIDQSSLQEMLATNGADLSALCSLLLQNQNIASLDESAEEVSSVSFSEPTSPATSESETESVRYKPYKKTKTVEQKQRKKAQNRTAATRYRIKKKDELKTMSEEADELEKKNKDLKGKVEGLRSEIDYLKNLMLDVIKARLTKGATPENLLSAVMAQ